MARFILSVTYPPAPRRAYTNVVSNRARNGFELFHVKGDNEKNKPRPNICGNCHRMPFQVSTNTPGTGMDAPTWRGAYDRWLILPQGRLNIIDFDFYRRIAEQGAPERKCLADVVGRPTAIRPGLGHGAGKQYRVLGFLRPTGHAQSHFRSEDDLTADLLDALERSAGEGAIVLQGDGRIPRRRESHTGEPEVRPPVQGRQPTSRPDGDRRFVYSKDVGVTGLERPLRRHLHRKAWQPGRSQSSPAGTLDTGPSIRNGDARSSPSCATARPP